MRATWLWIALGTVLMTASCQWAGDTKAVKVSFAALKTQLEDVNTRLTNAIQNNETDRVTGLDKELNTVLDAAMNQASAMNIMDREHLSIAVATARRCITDPEGAGAAARAHRRRHPGASRPRGADHQSLVT